MKKYLALALCCVAVSSVNANNTTIPVTQPIGPTQFILTPEKYVYAFENFITPNKIMVVNIQNNGKCDVQLRCGKDSGGSVDVNVAAGQTASCSTNNFSWIVPAQPNRCDDAMGTYEIKLH